VIASDSSTAWLVLPLLATPVLVGNLCNYYFADLFFAALCAVFFLTQQFSLWLSLPVLFLLHLTRESTIVLTAALIIVSLYDGRKGFAATVLAVGIFGLAVTSRFAHRGIPNKHGLSTVLFDVLKVFYNAAHLFGLLFWTDTNALEIVRRPIWTIHVHFGTIREFGFCGFDWAFPAMTLLIMSSAFGVLPLQLAIRYFRDWKAPASLDQRTAALYGALAFLMTPLVGNWIGRYVLYAFPLFWMAGPLAFSRGRLVRCVVVASVVSTWIPYVVEKILVPGVSLATALNDETPTTASLAAGLALEVLVYLVTFASISQSGKPSALTPSRCTSDPKYSEKVQDNL